MMFSRAFAAAPVRGGLAGLLGATMLLGIVGTSAGDLPKDRPERQRRGLTPATVSVQHVMDRNRAIMFLTEDGGIGAQAGSVAPGGYWISTKNPYIFDSGFDVAALIPSTTPGRKDTVFALGGPFTELSAGSLVFPGLDVFWDSTDPDDAANFPEACTVDEFRAQKFPSLQPFQGLPFPGFADQTICWAVNDITGSTCGACGGRRVGIEAVITLFTFSVPSVQDFVFAAIRIYNRTEFLNASNAPAQPPGPYDLEDTIIGFGWDPDVGGATDDQVAFLPDIQTMATWDADFRETQFDQPPGFAGITALDFGVDPVTGAPLELASFTVFTNGAPRPAARNRQEWYQAMAGDPSFVIFEVQPTDVRGLVSSNKFNLPAGEFVEIYVAYFFATAFGDPPALLLAQDPIRPGANSHPVFNNFRQIQRTATAVYNAGFVVATAPTKPAFELIPGDHQVTITWNADPVTFVNPFAKVARNPFSSDPEAPPTGQVLDAETIVYVPALDQGGTTGFVTAAQAGLTGRAVTNAAFNPNFVIQDFQGFKVWRSFTGLQEHAQVIAQFDLGDAIVGGDFCISAVSVFDEAGNFVTAVCTGIETFDLGTNTGLAFAVVDRGGSFPDPSTGAGLINGIPVYYSVTAYSVNCGEPQGGAAVAVTPDRFGSVNPPVACLTLESGLLPMRPATPRSESSAPITQAPSITAEALTADGSVCDTEEPTATVDPTTGEYVDFLDCSNALVGVTSSSLQPTEVPTGEFFLVIDRLEAPCDQGAPPACYELAPGDAESRVFFHWERANGSPATEILPQAGSFDQNFGFAVATSETSVGPFSLAGTMLFNMVFASDFSVIEDLEVNGQSLHLGQLGGTHAGEARPHAITGSALADLVNIGMRRGGSNAREYAHPSYYAQGGTSYELTWEVAGGNFTGTVRQLPGGQVIPKGGQPLNAENHSTAADFTAGWNWCIVGPGAPATVAAGVSPPTAGPCAPNNTVQLTVGSTFAIYVPGQSVYIEGLKQLPANGDTWTFLIDTGFQRALFGREGGGADPNVAAAPFSYHDINTAEELGEETSPIPFHRGVVNVFPGMRWRLSSAPGTLDVAAADLSQITIVPNPFIAVNEIMRGRGIQRLLITKLPPEATIRIYTISGNLVRVLEHTDGSGTEEWDVRSRFDLLVASGNYYAHITTPQGNTHLTRFAIIN